MVNHNENDKVHKISFGATQYNWRVPLWGTSDPARPAMGGPLTWSVPPGGTSGQASYIYESSPMFFFILCVSWVIIPAKHIGVVHHVHHPLHHCDACHAIHHGKACEVTSLFKQRSLRNEFAGFEVLCLTLSVCGMPGAWLWHPCVSCHVWLSEVYVTGAFRYGGHLYHPGSFPQTSEALGAYCEIFY